ncbi:LTA synthase family protein [Pelagicoccus sp. NFK12]|uniref:LTA synthase family protein n=1 Tax=Pelagicoccus enzymogenes TaxID=2773457 RepID=A0A927IJG7_9BACT|nr:LTA synthase family protein [Pelagicoccus enzymogenes]MBD5781515.1 LTA synthase family protein [Pelagicoccus enzymogenes]
MTRLKPLVTPFRIWAISTILCLTFIATNLVEWRWVQGRQTNNQVVNRIGFIGYIANEIQLSLKSFRDKKELLNTDPQPFLSFLNSVRSENEYTSESPTIPVKKNIIFIQLESVDYISVNAKHNGEKVMPFLSQLGNSHTNFSNVIDITNAGRSTDGEFLAIASLPPVPNTPIYQNFDLSILPSLPRVLNKAGYYTFSIHGNKGTYWNRETAHDQLGYQESFFRDDLDDSEIVGWGISDKSILSQAAEKIGTANQPTFAHIILLSNHHPYQYVPRSRGMPSKGILMDHISSLRYVDNSIAFFFSKLESLNLIENSIIAIYSDHESSLAKRLASKLELADIPCFPKSIPLIICGLQNEPQTIEKASALSDLPVIVLESIGIETPHTFSGNSLNSTRPILNPYGQLMSVIRNEPSVIPSSIAAQDLTRLALINPDGLKQQK